MRRTNADRQRAYRDRNRNARNAPVGKIGAAAPGRRGKDYRKDGVEHIFIGNFGYGDVYATVIQPKGKS